MIPDLIESVASLGIVVVAPATSAGKCDDNHWKDMLHAIEGSKAQPSLHSALQHVDWTRVGIMGHSMGGYGSLNGAADVLSNPSKYSFSLKAMLDSHGYIGDYASIAPKISIPSMFTTGSEDGQSRLKGAFELVTSTAKVLAEVSGADHMYPATNGALNPFDAHFMGCHVADLQSSCDKVYGSGSGTICEANSMSLCEVVGGSTPAPTPRPSPTPPSPAPTPQPSPSPSPSPDAPSVACQQCFSSCIAGSACSSCVATHKGACASSCTPFPFSQIETWFCGSGLILV